MCARKRHEKIQRGKQAVGMTNVVDVCPAHDIGLSGPIEAESLV